MTIGYVGLGAMGRSLASHLPGKFETIVWDLNLAAVQDFVTNGGKAANSMAELGQQCELVIFCLPKSANVEQALFGENGLELHLRPGSVVVDQTSGDSVKTKAFAERLAKRQISLVDAPVAGGVPSAVAGNITIMASGDQAAYERALPVLRAMTANVFYCSDNVGDAQIVKAINNIVNSANRGATLEVLAAARRLGLDTAKVTDALNAGAGESFITRRLLPAIVEQRSSTDFALALMVKDLNQAAQIAITHATPIPISEASRALFNTGLSILGEQSRLDDLVPFMEKVMQTPFSGDSAADPSCEQISEDEALQLISSVMAACNRLAIIENAALAIAAGLDISRVAPIIMSGSAASHEAGVLFEVLAGTVTGDGKTLGAMIDDLTRVAQIGSQCAIPMLLINQVRSQCLRLAETLGRDSSINTALAG